MEGAGLVLFIATCFVLENSMDAAKLKNSVPDKVYNAYQPQHALDSKKLGIFRIVLKSLINKKRTAHHAPELALDDGLNAGANEYALSLAQKRDSSTHSEAAKQGTVGENLAGGCSSEATDDLTAKDVVNLWYRDEIVNYNFDKPGPNQKGVVGHFTAMIWKATTKIGIGKAKYTKMVWVENEPPKQGGRNVQMNCYVVVARFSPPGNVHHASDNDKTIQYYQTNVLPI